MILEMTADDSREDRHAVAPVSSDPRGTGDASGIGAAGGIGDAAGMGDGGGITERGGGMRTRARVAAMVASLR